MRRGTTPTHTFNLSLDESLIKEIKIIYAQSDEQLFCKRKSDCVFEGTTVKTTLSQEETFKFDCKKMVQIQIRALTTDGQAPSTEIILVPVEKCLDDEVLT